MKSYKISVTIYIHTFDSFIIKAVKPPLLDPTTQSGVHPWARRHFGRSGAHPLSWPLRIPLVILDSHPRNGHPPYWNVNHPWTKSHRP